MNAPYSRSDSHCYDESCDSVSIADQNVSPPEPNQDTGSKYLGETSEKEAGRNVELVEPDDMNSGDSPAKQVMEAVESCDTNGFRDKIELIEDFLSVDESESDMKDAATVCLPLIYAEL